MRCTHLIIVAGPAHKEEAVPTPLIPQWADKNRKPYSPFQTTAPTWVQRMWEFTITHGENL